MNRAEMSHDIADYESENQLHINYKDKYKILKQKLKHLIYENECFQDVLRSAQRQLLSVTKDKMFLLDRLLQYEKVDVSSTESEDTDSSEDAEASKQETCRKRKSESASNSAGNGASLNFQNKLQMVAKKKRSSAPKPKASNQSVVQQAPHVVSDGHMTPEEVERHLQSRQSFLELLPEKAPPTVPTEMFSNDPSLDSESNDVGEMETSPSNLGEDINTEFTLE